MSSENQRSKDILIAILSLLGVLGAALLGNWDKVFPKPDSTSQPIPSTVLSVSPPVQSPSSSLPSPVSSLPSSKHTPTNSEPSQERILIISASVNNQNSYSNSYDPMKVIDGNIESYWSTKSGAILDVELDFFFDKLVTTSAFRIYSPDKGHKYTQPKKINFVFLDEFGNEISEKQVLLIGSYATWQQYELSSISKVRRVRVRIQKLTKEQASYLTFNEIEFFSN